MYIKFIFKYINFDNLYVNLFTIILKQFKNI